MSRENPAGALLYRRLKNPYAVAAGLFVWPLVTVSLVLFTLYLDRMNTFKEVSAQLAAAEVETAGHLLEAGSGGVAADLAFLAQDRHIKAALAENGATGSYQRLKRLFSTLIQANPLYERVCLLDHLGALLLQVPAAGDSAPAPFHPSDPIFQGGEGGATSPYLFPPVLTFRLGVEAEQHGQTLRFGMRLHPSPGQRAASVEIHYCLDCLLQALNKAGIGENSQLILVSKTWYDSRLEERSPPLPGQRAEYMSGRYDPTERGIAAALGGAAQGETGHLFQDGNLYSYAAFQNRQEDGREGTASWLILVKIPSEYFSARQYEYLEFLLLLAAALLVPSLAVCAFLARARIKADNETELRYHRQETHLEELEERIAQRTRELDERNAQLSREIDERVKTEKQLQQSNELLSGMLGSIDGIIYVADFKSHEILFANDYLKALFGFDPVGKPCWQFLHSSQEGPCEFCSNHLLLDEDGEPAAPYQWEYQNPFNKKWYAAKDQAIKWSDGRYVKLEIAVDITEQKRLQHFLNEARKQAEIATGIRSRFVALVAHDLKSPFYSMTQMIKRILERETFSHRVHEQFLENIASNGQRMLKMIDNLLAINRFEAGDLKLEKTFFDVSEMADEVLQNFSPLAVEKGVRLGNAIPAGTMLYADKYLYFVVLNNLVSNSIKFSEHGGVVELHLPDRQRPMCVAVSDNGKGMSQEYADNLFKADVKTSRRGTQGEQGSGLGLIFCKEIVEAHGGTISVTSKRGVGTVFYVALPECCSLERGVRKGGKEPRAE